MNNLAEKYDFEMFTDHGNAAPALPEIQPRKQPKVTKIPKQQPKNQPKKKIKRNWAQIIAGSLAFIIVTGIAGLRIEKEVELTVLTDQILTTREELNVAQATERQLTMQLERKFNNIDFQKYAKEQLGLYPIEQNQVTYINATQQDKGVVYQQIETTTWDKILKFFKNLIQ